MQYVKFPMSVLRITQGYGLEVDGVSTAVSGGTYSHTGSYALDLGGTDTGAEYLYAPCDVEVVRHYKGGTGYNAVWYQTLEPVMCADGQQRELVFMLLHANDTTITELGITVGKQFKQGEAFYKEGTGGGVATHCHLEVGLAPFSGTGWTKSSYVDDRGANVWIINNKLIPSEIFYLTNKTTVVEDMGYNWRYLSTDCTYYSTPTGVRVLTGTGKNVQYFYTASVDDIAGNYLPEGSEYVAVGYTTVADSYGFTYVKFIYDDGNEYWMALLDDRIELFEREVETNVSKLLDQTFFLQVDGTDFNLNVYGNDTVENERNVNIYIKEDVQAQRWVLKETTAGLKLFTKIDEAFALNIYTVDDNCSVYTAEGNDADSILGFELVGIMLYKIKSVTHNKYLYVDGDLVSGANVAWTDDASAATNWRFITEAEMFPTYVEYTTNKVIHVLDNNTHKVEYFYSTDVNDVAGVLATGSRYKALGYTTEADENGFTYIKFEKGGAEYYTAYLTDRMEVIDENTFTENGIDVSDHQGVIDWAAVATSGQKFAIIKAVGTNSDGIYISTYWESNYQGAKDNGLKVGAYLYTYAFNETEAEEELTYLFQALEGKTFEYPIYIDVEDSLLYQNCTVDEITNTVKYLCTRLTEEGYFPAIYTYSYFAKNYLNMDELVDYDLWIADYTGYVTYQGDYDVWQYSSTGSVNGISGNVDMNISYKDYATLLASNNDGNDESTYPEEDNNEGGNVKMSTLNTRIVLRNDSTINWDANATTVLLKGEVGIEFLTDGKAKLKIGDGVTPWSTLAYFSDDYTKTEVDALIAAAKSAAISEAVATVLGEGVDEKYDTLVEVANWILSDTTSSAALVAKVNTIEADYLKGADKEELQGNINALSAFVGTLPEGTASTTVVAYIQEVVNGLNIGDYAKAADLTLLAARVEALETKVATLETNVTGILESIADIEAELAKKVDIVEGYRMVSEDEGNKLEKLVLNQDGSVSVSGTIAAGNVEGLADWITARAATLKGLSENNLTDALLGKLNGIAEGAQVNVIEGVRVNGTPMPITDKMVDVKATDVVKASTEVTVAEDGTLGVGTISVNKLVQGENEVLILNGGSAAI